MIYKSCRFVDCKLRWIVVDENERIININPSKEELKGLEKEIYFKKIYNKTNTCDRCGINFNIATGNPRREYKKEGNWTGKWDCPRCWQDFDPNSQNNLIKSMRDRRTGNLDLNSEQAKGDLFQELTCRWRSTVSIIPVEDLNKKLDNYNSPIDHSRDSELGIIQTQGRLYNKYNQLWNFNSLEREWEKEFDNMICYCVSKDGKVIERLYIFPKKEIENRKGIGIYKNPTDSHSNPKTSWYDEYRVKDEDTIKRVNDIWKEIINDE